MVAGTLFMAMHVTPATAVAQDPIIIGAVLLRF